MGTGKAQGWTDLAAFSFSVKPLGADEIMRMSTEAEGNGGSGQSRLPTAYTRGHMGNDFAEEMSRQDWPKKGEETGKSLMWLQ